MKFKITHSFPIQDWIDEVKIDWYYLTKNLWHNDYGLHFFAGMLFQGILLFLSARLDWFDQWFAPMCIFSVIQAVLWTGKEVTSQWQSRWSFGILPNSSPDYRDARFSIYGFTVVNIVYTMIYLIFINNT